MTKLISLLVLSIVMRCPAVAGAIDVTYALSGSPSAWNLNFTVANNLNAWPAQEVYLFGVALSHPGITDSPAGFDPNVYGVFFTFFDGGQPNTYNNIWYDSPLNSLFAGTSLPGFRVHLTDIAPPDIVWWFAYSYTTTLDPGDLYTGSDAFFTDPDLGIAGFEGLASAVSSPTPEPSTLAMLALGLASGALLRHRTIRD